MTLYRHEIRRSRLSLIIWTAAISFLLLVCIVIYPEMEAAMSEMSEMFANMGAFSDALNMETMTFSSFIGYFSLECGEMLGIGGAIFASIIAISALSKEESDKTAEFLYTHPVPRRKAFFSKLSAVVTEIMVLNFAVCAVCSLAVFAMGIEVEWKPFFVLFITYFILQLQFGLMCFGLSAFFKKKAVGVGLGLAMGLYFVNIVANLTEETEFFRYVTPFAYVNGNYIIENSALEWKFVLIGAAVAVACLVLGFVKYEKKDIC